jgi:hypothetical protein
MTAAGSFALEPIYASLVEERGDIPAQTRQAVHKLFNGAGRAVEPSDPLPDDTENLSST